MNRFVSQKTYDVNFSFIVTRTNLLKNIADSVTRDGICLFPIPAFITLHEKEPKQ